MNNLFDLFRQNKTKMATIKDPMMLLRHLKDNDIITENQYEIYELNSNEDSVYKLLEFIESRKQPHVEKFWKCVNQEHILTRYPELSELIKNVNTRGLKGNGEIYQAGPSSQSTNTQKKTPGQIKKKGKKDLNILIKHKKLLPVTCGDKKAVLVRKRLFNEKNFIYIGEKYITPGELEKLGGKGTQKDWKKSIKCYGYTLKTLNKMGLLKLPKLTGMKVTARK
ncbi:uncharacterized protein [Misgurnus anguillicaudatus]|uniref:uncharacterized protein n=1 Tax=Misgurnus anguillicaudatus TaxID=75329 RepID=UPI003CCF5591